MPLYLSCALSVLAAAPAEPVILRSPEGLEAVFEPAGAGLRLAVYRDPKAGRAWSIEGPLMAFELADGRQADLDGGRAVTTATDHLVLRAELPTVGLAAEVLASFGTDGRTLRLAPSVRATGGPVTLRRVVLLQARIPGETLERVGPGHVSCPVIGAGLFCGVEHPAAATDIEGDRVRIAQAYDRLIGADAVPLPPAVIGCAPDGTDRAAIKRAFLRYLDTVRVHPRDVHIHYNNWWTMPVPFTEADVLRNIAELKAGLEGTGFFFDSYAMDMGWSDPHTVWQVRAAGYPEGFARIRDALAPVGGKPGLWVSPSSLYPPALDNAWLAENGYETTPGSHIGRFACLARGGRYQRAFRDAVLRHAREGGLGHVKFDGLAWPCAVPDHGHLPGPDSFVAIAEGLVEVLDALRAQNPDIALEPTCLGYWPSPWWLLHTPFVIGPFGDDSPRGVSPCPEWLESMTTARDAEILNGQDAFWMPSSALECFDTIIQCPGDSANHVVMAVARGHWFQSTYINPKFMDRDEWRFFADLMRWARANRELLQNPVLLGGSPRERQAYGYAYGNAERMIAFARNPWIEPATIALPGLGPVGERDVQLLYPRDGSLGRVGAGAELPPLELGPYELAVVEVVPAAGAPKRPRQRPPDPIAADWSSGFAKVVFEPEPAPFGPDWTSPDGDAAEVFEYRAAGRVRAPAPAELCVLVESGPDAAPAACEVSDSGRAVELRESGSRGAFAATGKPPAEQWQWFTAPLPAGDHTLTVRIAAPGAPSRCGVWVRAKNQAPAPRRRPNGAEFPLPRQAFWPRSVALAPLAEPAQAGLTERRTRRRIERIDGRYLDTLDWLEATAGWGQTRRNRSIMDLPMTLGGRRYHRGIGAHAPSRIVYELPEGFARLAAIIGCDQEVWANSIVFVVAGDGRELYRSPLMRRDDPPLPIDVPIAGVKRLALILEDGGDGITADHGDWAEARLLRR